MDKILEALKGFLKDGVDIEAVKTALEAPTKALNPLEGLSAENVGNLLSKQPTLKAAFDRKVEETNKKWTEANFDRMYQEKYSKDHPEADPSKKETLELKAKLDKLERESKRKDILISARKKAKELKLPDEVDGILERFIEDDEEKTFANLDKLAFIPTTIQKSIEEALKGKIKSETPKSGPRTPGKVSVNDMKDWTPEQINEAFEKGLVE